MRALPGLFFSIVVAAIWTTTARSESLEIYAGGSENEFTLLRETKSVAGYQFGVRDWFLSWLGGEFGSADFGSVKGSFPVQPVYPPGTVFYDVVFPAIGTNTLHVSARAVYALPVLRASFGTRLSGWLAFGPERFESKIGSDLFILPPTVLTVTPLAASGESRIEPRSSQLYIPSYIEAGYSQTRRSWAPVAKTGLRLTIDSRWAVEAELHATGAPAISDPQIYPHADIGRRRLDIWGAGFSIVCRLGHLR
jgi:hypothetical protein